MRVTRPTEGLPPVPPEQGPSSEGGHAALVDPAESPSAGAMSGRFVQLLGGVARELDRGETLTSTAIRGAGGQVGMSPERLIALQAGIYRYSEAVDLVTKLVDKGTQAVRTTLQNQ